MSWLQYAHNTDFFDFSIDSYDYSCVHISPLIKYTYLYEAPTLNHIDMSSNINYFIEYVRNYVTAYNVYPDFFVTYLADEQDSYIGFYYVNSNIMEGLFYDTSRF